MIASCNTKKELVVVVMFMPVVFSLEIPMERHCRHLVSVWLNHLSTGATISGTSISSSAVQMSEFGDVGNFVSVIVMCLMSNGWSQQSYR